MTTGIERDKATIADRPAGRPPPPRHRSRLGLLAAGLLAAGTACATFPAHAQTAAAPKQPPAASKQAPAQDSGKAAAAAQEAEARALLMRMANFLANAPAFSVTVASTYDSVQDDGLKVEFGAVRHILLSRPNLLRIETDQHDGKQRRLYFDGKTMTLYSPDAQVYASTARPGTVDEAIQFFLDTLGAPLPLAMLLQTTLPKEMEHQISAADIVGPETLDGQAVTHVVARAKEADVQVWIAKADPPVPLRFVITYRHAKGEPQFRATLRDWNFSPAVDPASFVFVPPKDAYAVAIMVPSPDKRPAAGGKRR